MIESPIAKRLRLWTSAPSSSLSAENASPVSQVRVIDVPPIGPRKALLLRFSLLWSRRTLHRDSQRRTLHDLVESCFHQRAIHQESWLNRV